MVYAALLALAALDAAGYGMLAPVLPEIGDRTGTGPAVAGALVACFALGQLAGYPPAALLGQRRGASRTLSLSLVLLLVGDAGFVLGDGLAVWFPARVVQGLGAAGLWIGVTFAILEHWPRSAYQRLTGVLAAYAVGSVCGPAIGAIEGVRAPFLLHGLVTLVAFLPVLALGRPEAAAELGADRGALRTRAFAVAAAGVVLMALTLGTMDGPLPLHFAERLTQPEIAGLYVLAAAVVAGGAIVAGRLHPAVALGVAALVIPVGIGVAGVTGTVAPWAAGVMLAGVGLGLGESGALGVLLGSIPRERIVTAWVIWSQLWAAGYLVGPAIAGLVAELWGYAALGAVPLVGSLVVAYTLRRGLGAAAVTASRAR